MLPTDLPTWVISLLLAPFGLVIGAASLFVQGDAFEVIRKLIETVGKGIGMLGAMAMAFVGRDRNIVRHP